MNVNIRKVIKFCFGTESNLLLKLNISCFLTGIIFFMFALIFDDNGIHQPALTFTFIAGIMQAIWISTIKNQNTLKEIGGEFLRLVIFFVFLTFSLNFCMNQSMNYNSCKLFIFSLFSCIVMLCSFFYLVSKFIDILKAVKKILIQIKQKLFNSVQPATSKAKALIENITAFLVSIAGLGIAIKTIVEPLINLFQ